MSPSCLTCKTRKCPSRIESQQNESQQSELKYRKESQQSDKIGKSPNRTESHQNESQHSIMLPVVGKFISVDSPMPLFMLTDVEAFDQLALR